uniref:Uncharacterized protein n=1 Tax=Pararge aegeria TaxID=116150 RepID=S4NXZ5_9NEOP
MIDRVNITLSIQINKKIHNITLNNLKIIPNVTKKYKNNVCLDGFRSAAGDGHNKSNLLRQRLCEVHFGTANALRLCASATSPILVTTDAIRVLMGKKANDSFHQFNTLRRCYYCSRTRIY